MVKLNKTEIKFFTEVFEDIMTKEELKEVFEEQTKIKTFLQELKRLEKKYGYEPHSYNIMNIPIEMYEDIEYYIYDNDGKEGAKQYFENRY